jgi:rubrerythrin
MVNESRSLDFERIIAFAVAREEEAAAAYAEMMASAETPGLKEFFRELRDEERDHKRLLEGLDPAGAGSFAAAAVEDLGITDGLRVNPPRPDMSYQDALIFAARKEERAARLYAGLAAGAARDEDRRLFEFLASREKLHKLKLESEYDKRILAED